MKPCTLLDRAIKDLAGQRKKALTDAKKVEIRNIQMELRFLKMLFLFYKNWEYAGKKYVLLVSFMSQTEIRNCKKWNAIYYGQWLKKADLLIPEIQELSVNFIHSSSPQYRSSTSNQIPRFLVTIHENLADICSSKAHIFVPVKEQIEVLQQKLKFLRDLIKFTANRCTSHEKKLKDFRVKVQNWANRVACLLFLYWVDQSEEESVPKLKTMLLHVLETKPFTPAVKRVLLGALKVSKTLHSETFLVGDLVANFVDLLLEDLMSSMEDSIRTSVRDGLIISITFLMDLPQKRREYGNEILAKAAAVVDKASSLFYLLLGISGNNSL